MAAPIVELDRRSMRRLEQRLQRLGSHVLVAASQEAAEAAGKKAQILLQVAFRRHIEGGPAVATQVRPGSPLSSVLVQKSDGGKDGVSVDLALNRLAARWMQFQLGDRRVRNPGVVGIARRRNFVPQVKALRKAGIRLPHGNIPRGRLRRLVDETKTTSASDKGIFYGRPNGRKGAVGFYQRQGRNAAPKLLIAAAKQSRYRDNVRLQSAWTTSVERAGGRMGDDAARAIMRLVARMK